MNTTRDLKTYRILWPTNFSDASHAAMTHAKRLAEEKLGEILVLHVATLPDGCGTGIHADSYHDELRKRLQDICLGGVNASRLLLVGSPAEQICRVAKENDCDIIVLGTHETHGVDHFSSGGVADYVVRNANCPVTAVRLDARSGVNVADGSYQEILKATDVTHHS